MTTMNQDEKEAFLADLHVGVVSFTRTALGPLAVPIWYDYEPGGKLWFVTGSDSRKAHLVEVGTRISLCAQAESLPYKYVMVEGAITAIDSHDGEILPMAVRYLGDELGRQYADGNTADASIVIRMNPEHWLGVDFSKLM